MKIHPIFLLQLRKPLSFATLTIAYNYWSKNKSTSLDHSIIHDCKATNKDPSQILTVSTYMLPLLALDGKLALQQKPWTETDSNGINPTRLLISHTIKDEILCNDDAAAINVEVPNKLDRNIPFLIIYVFNCCGQQWLQQNISILN